MGRAADAAADLPLAPKLWLTLTALVPAVVLVTAVLGSILAGVASPTEAAGLGAVAALVLAVVYRRFSWALLREVLRRSLVINAMIMLVVVGGTLFTSMFLVNGGAALVNDVVGAFDRAAATPIADGTALRMLCTDGKLEAGETVRALGADEAIDTSTHDFSREAWRLAGKRGVDLCVNFTGGDTYVPSLRTLRRGGRLVTCGATAGFEPKTDLRFIRVRELAVLGSNGYSQADVETALALALAHVAAAERLMEDRDVIGKIVLVP